MVWARVFPGPMSYDKATSLVQDRVQYKIYEMSESSVVLFSAGNLQTTESTKNYCEHIRETMGATVVTYDYPGYVENERGHQTNEDEVFAASETMFQLVRRMYPNARVCLYGQSVGCWPTCYLAAKHNDDRSVVEVVLESGFSSISAMCLPECLRFNDVFGSNIHFLGLFRKDVVLNVIHHVHDTLVPFSHATKMHKEALRLGLVAHLYSVENGNHNDPIDISGISRSQIQVL